MPDALRNVDWSQRGRPVMIFQLFADPMPSRGDSGTEKATQECPKSSQRSLQNHQEAMEKRVCSPLGCQEGLEVRPENFPKIDRKTAELLRTRQRKHNEFEKSGALRLARHRFSEARWRVRRAAALYKYIYIYI
jgi:hypothetical protein